MLLSILHTTHPISIFASRAAGTQGVNNKSDGNYLLKAM